MTPATVVLPALDVRSHEMLRIFQGATRDQLQELTVMWENRPTNAMRLGVQRDTDEWALLVIHELFLNVTRGLNMLATGIRVHGTSEVLKEVHQQAMAWRILACLRPYFEANPTAAVYLLEEI